MMNCTVLTIFTSLQDSAHYTLVWGIVKSGGTKNVIHRRHDQIEYESNRAAHAGQKQRRGYEPGGEVPFLTVNIDPLSDEQIAWQHV
mgnify:CR=1 FL=1